DLVIGELNNAPVILRNNGTKNHWLGIKLIGTKSNRDGIGARIVLIDAGGRRQIFDVSTAGSYLSSNDPRIIAGLGVAASVRAVEIHWPSGRVQTIERPDMDRYLTVDE